MDTLLLKRGRRHVKKRKVLAQSGPTFVQGAVVESTRITTTGTERGGFLLILPTLGVPTLKEVANEYIHILRI